MSQQNFGHGQQGQQGINLARDPATGQFLDDQQRRQLQQYAQQHPEEVRRAYARDEPIPGISSSEETGQRRQGGQQMGGQQQSGGRQQTGGQGMGGGQQFQQQPQQFGGQRMSGGQGMGGGQQFQQQPQQQQGHIPAQQQPSGQQAGFPGQQGRGADQGAQDERHSQEFRQEMSEKARHQPRDPQTGQFQPSGQQTYDPTQNAYTPRESPPQQGGQQQGGQQMGGQRQTGGQQMSGQQGQQRR